MTDQPDVMGGYLGTGWSIDQDGHWRQPLDQIAAALAAAQGEFQPIPKTETNPHYRSRYATLAAAIHTNKTILAKHGLAVTQHIGYDPAGETLTTWLLHKSGQTMSTTMRLHPVKDDPQGQASAVTYARRQQFLAITGMAPEGEDTDAQPAEPPARVTVAQAKRELLKAVDGDKGAAKELWAKDPFLRGGSTVEELHKWLLSVVPPCVEDPERDFE